LVRVGRWLTRALPRRVVAAPLAVG